MMTAWLISVAQVDDEKTPAEYEYQLSSTVTATANGPLRCREAGCAAVQDWQGEPVAHPM